MSFIGIIGAERLDINCPLLGLLKAQKEAVKLLQAGKDMRTIKVDTGWELGVDKKWRYEIADPFHTTEEIEDHIKQHFGEPINIRYCMNDISLLIAYPAFEQLKLYTMYTPTKSFLGYFNPINYGMVVCMGFSNSPFNMQTGGILLHEVQHLIQEEENFARGGNTSIGRSRYLRLAGEVEARNVCNRHYLTDTQRRSSLRIDTQDIQDKEQIIVLK